MDEKDLIRYFEMYFPSICKQAVWFKQNGPFSVLAKLECGDFVEFYSLANTIKTYPRDPEAKFNDRATWSREFMYKLFRLIGDNGLARKKLSSETGISEPAMSSYMHRKKTPSVLTGYKLSKYFNCDIDDLV